MTNRAQFLWSDCWRMLAVAILLVVGCRPATTRSSGDTIATATSYLESAGVDVLGENNQVLRLAEPGACPGHFDIRPSQAAELRRCQVLLRFDFQKSLDAVLKSSGTNHLFVIEVKIHDGLCLPTSYLSACRQIADACVVQGRLKRATADARLQDITARLDGLAQQATKRVAQAGLTGTPVITSAHQRDFCEWLGLKVIATFRPADTSSVAEIDEAIRAGKLAGVKLIIANLPEGRRTADALAERLGAGAVVFGNFPELNNGRVSFDELLQGNVAALLRAHGP